MTLRRLCTILSLIVLLAAMLFAAPPTGKITGKITDKTTHEPLIFANVLVVGTILGNSSDADGKFEIPGVPEGEYSIRVSYVGYKTRVDSSIRVSADQTTTLNIELEAEAVQNAPVIVTAQASGQNQAINQQLSTVGITNVVSSARIQELPDANAAESVGRLPGVSLLRSGGEGNEVVIRGLEPKYNVVTIDGVRMASSNANDRSADLSMISPYSLDGIEVIKVVTPDLDPDVLGGTVNFKMHEAKGEEPGLRFNLIGQQGYTGLSDAYEKFRNYKYVGSLEGRFFDDHSLGLFAQADIERRNLTSNEFGANYASASGSTTAYLTTGLNLNDVIRDRARDNATVVADYKLPNGKLVLSNFLSSGTTEDQNRGELFDLTNLVDNYTFGYTKSTLNQITNSLETDYNLPIFHADIKFSHSYSETNDPNDWTIGFHNSDPHLGPFQPEANLDPHAIPPAALVDSAANLNSVVLSNSFARERALTASLDLDTRLDLTDWNASAVFKFGGKFRHQTRSNEQQQSGGDGPAILSATYFDGLITNHFGLPSQYAQNTNIPISPFLDPNFSYGDFLGGDYQMVLPMNYDYMSQMANLISTNAANISRNDSITWNWNKFNGISFNYDGYENQTGAYGMTTIDLGTAVTLIPGIRYQDEYTSYTAPQGIEDANSQHGGPYRHYDTTVVVDNSYWLPDVLLKVRVLPFADLRLAYTTTLAYPDFSAIVPRIDVNGTAIAWNNSQLSPSKSRNYDASMSFFDNNIGLLTVGGFWKKIDNLIYPVNEYLSDTNQIKKYYPSEYAGNSGFANGVYNITTLTNLSNTLDNYGVELEWQTHFWYLPNPLNGLVLSVNYTHVFSTTKYPYVITLKQGRRGVPMPVDTSYSAPLLYQPDKILNISLGYDYQSFSARLSMLYQADIFTGTQGSPVWLQLHTTTAAYTRWDLAVKQNLPWFGLQAYGDVNNLNSAVDRSIIAAQTGVPNSEQSYGLNGDIGLRLRF